MQTEAFVYMHTITLFIHGTLPPRRVLSIPPIRKFFYCPELLSALSQVDESLHVVSLLKQLNHASPERFPLESCYLFGWDGQLKGESRKNAAAQLSKILQQLKMDNPVSKLQLITHSHGGNVVLSLAQYPDTPTIDTVILLACPVQQETAHYVSHPLFKSIYSIHSHGDLLQIIDPQGITRLIDQIKQYGFTVLADIAHLGPLFSERHFSPSPNLKQLWVEFQARPLMHIEFLLPSFISHLPQIIEHLEKQPYSPTEYTYKIESAE